MSQETPLQSVESIIIIIFLKSLIIIIIIIIIIIKDLYWHYSKNEYCTTYFARVTPRSVDIVS